MKRRLNSTGRKRIPRDLFTIRVGENPDTGDRQLSADLSGIGTLNVDRDAHLILEPYVKQSSVRFDVGPIGDLPPTFEASLDEIDRGAAVSFRVLIVDAREFPGRILASAERIRPTDLATIDDRKSILPLRETDLGESVWRLDVDRDAPPVLLINNRVPSLRQRLEQDPLLQGAIFPHAVVTILRVLLMDSVDDDEEWVKDWRTFVEDLLGEEFPDSPPEEPDEFLERARDAFDLRMKWRSRIDVDSDATEDQSYE